MRRIAKLMTPGLRRTSTSSSEAPATILVVALGVDPGRHLAVVCGHRLLLGRAAASGHPSSSPPPAPSSTTPPSPRLQSPWEAQAVGAGSSPRPAPGPPPPGPPRAGAPRPVPAPPTPRAPPRLPAIDSPPWPGNPQATPAGEDLLLERAGVPALGDALGQHLPGDPSACPPVARPLLRAPRTSCAVSSSSAACSCSESVGEPEPDTEPESSSSSSSSSRPPPVIDARRSNSRRSASERSPCGCSPFLPGHVLLGGFFAGMAGPRSGWPHRRRAAARRHHHHPSARRRPSPRLQQTLLSTRISARAPCIARPFEREPMRKAFASAWNLCACAIARINSCNVASDSSGRASNLSSTARNDSKVTAWRHRSPRAASRCLRSQRTRRPPQTLVCCSQRWRRPPPPDRPIHQSYNSERNSPIVRPVASTSWRTSDQTMRPTEASDSSSRA